MFLVYSKAFLGKNNFFDIRLLSLFLFLCVIVDYYTHHFNNIRSQNIPGSKPSVLFQIIISSPTLKYEKCAISP